MLHAVQVSKNLGGQPILHQINLHVKKGECLGILGPNGSGKSTLLKLLVGEESPDHGRIYLHNQDLFQYPSKLRARKIAVLSQEGLGTVPFTVEEIVQMGRFPYQGKWPWQSIQDQQIVNQVMKATNVEHLSKRFLKQLSGGERQRVEIAKAMAQWPELLVLDEPTANLDIQYQLMILDLLRSWQQEKQLTILIVLHDLNLAAQFCDRILLLKGGRNIMIGTPTEVIQEHWIKEVYGVSSIVISHPEISVPQVIIPARK